MKKIILVLFILLFTCGCDNNDGRVLNVLNWSSYIPNEVISDFSKESGIKVNYSTYSSNEELLAKISSSKEGTYDLIFPSDYMLEVMIRREMLDTMDTSKLENFNNLNENYLGLEYDKNNEYSIPFIAASTVISYNREVIKDDIISYNDLLNPKYKNEIVLIDDQRIIIGMALLANGFDMNSVDEDELEIAKNWLKELRKNLKAFDSDSPKNFLITKEASIAVLWNAEGALANMQNSNIKNIFPLEGFALSIDNFAIPKGAKNKSEIYEFIDYILRPEVMAKIVSSYPYKNLNKETDLLLDESYLNNNAANIPDIIMGEGIFVKNIGDKVKLYDQIWAEIK